VEYSNHCQSAARIGSLACAFALCIAAVQPAAAQNCSWGGTTTVTPPSSAVLQPIDDMVSSPLRVSTDADGNVYAVDPSAGRLIVRDADGRLAEVVDGFSNPSAVAVDGAGNILVAEIGSGSVSVFDRDWTLLFKLGRGDHEFSIPNDIVVDPDPSASAVYVSDGANHRIAVYGLDGAFRFSFGSLGTEAGRMNFCRSSIETEYSNTASEVDPAPDPSGASSGESRASRRTRRDGSTSPTAFRGRSDCSIPSAWSWGRSASSVGARANSERPRV